MKTIKKQIVLALIGLYHLSYAREIRFHARGGKIWQDHLTEIKWEREALGFNSNSTPNFYTQLIDHIQVNIK